MVIIGECEGKAVEWSPRSLADAMDTHGFRYHHVKKAVVMLRGLQDEHDKVQTDLDIALSYIKQYELQIKDLKQQVAFLEDWRDTWSPFLKAITEKVNEE
jgi:hypothetical protein